MGLGQDEQRKLVPDEIGDPLAASGLFLHKVVVGRGSWVVARGSWGFFPTTYLLCPTSFLHMNELILIFQKLAVQIFLHERQYTLQQSIQRRLVGADHGDSESCPLQKVLVPDLGAR